MLTVENAAAEAAHFMQTIPSYPKTFDGRGIVTCAGGPKYLTCAWVLINMLRNVGCKLPIEVWYLGEEEGDPEWIQLVQSLNVRCVNAHAVAKLWPHPRLAGWESKAYAVLHSRFKEVLFLDADNVPVIDPTYLFDDPEYIKSGTIFWPDSPIMSPDNLAWQVFGVPYQHMREVESGQLLVDKSRCWKAINLANWYNENSDFFYKYVYGDKDTFPFAWRKTHTPFVMSPYNHEPIRHGLYQFDLTGRRLFQHRIHDKWSLLGNTVCDGFMHEAECFEFVRELGRLWSPVGFLTRKLTNGERSQMAVIGEPKYRLVQVGRRGRPVELSGSGCVSGGASSREAYWWFRDGMVSFLDTSGKPTCTLMPQTDGSWFGCEADAPDRLVRLIRMRR